MLQRVITWVRRLAQALSRHLQHDNGGGLPGGRGATLANFAVSDFLGRELLTQRLNEDPITVMWDDLLRGGIRKSSTGRNGRDERRRAISQAAPRAMVNSQPRTGPWSGS
jgi:hypothetical protein